VQIVTVEGHGQDDAMVKVDYNEAYETLQDWLDMGYSFDWFMLNGTLFPVWD
jgi:hypothetical protein